MAWEQCQRELRSERVRLNTEWQLRERYECDMREDTKSAWKAARHALLKLFNVRDRTSGQNTEIANFVGSEFHGNARDWAMSLGFAAAVVDSWGGAAPHQVTQANRWV